MYVECKKKFSPRKFRASFSLNTIISISHQLKLGVLIIEIFNSLFFVVVVVVAVVVSVAKLVLINFVLLKIILRKLAWEKRK